MLRFISESNYFAMNIEKKESGKTGKFFIQEDDDVLADINWLVNDDDNYVINHTSVSEKLSGQGIGIKLLDAVVDMARDKNKKVIAGCEFAKVMFKRHEEKYKDVWEKRDEK
ncbi:MAG TPA: GNAT family N-acetyltransferase [Lentimicrobium sp.]|nr:GNAT family N-acetyltransferase [Lentimicrobium sp.]